MASKVKTQAEAFDEICYAAFSTHFRTVFARQLKDFDAHEKALSHWNENLPHIATLWHGIVKGMIVNLTQAQTAGLIPPLLTVAPASALPGLGGAPHVPAADTSPAGLARRIGSQMAARDTPPGLAIGRETETDE